MEDKALRLRRRLGSESPGNVLDLAVIDIETETAPDFAEEIEGQPIARRGQLVIAEKVIKLLEKLKPADREAA